MSESVTSRAECRQCDISVRSMDFGHCWPPSWRGWPALQACDAVHPSDSHQMNRKAGHDLGTCIVQREVMTACVCDIYRHLHSLIAGLISRCLRRTTGRANDLIHSEEVSNHTATFTWNFGTTSLVACQENSRRTSRAALFHLPSVPCVPRCATSTTHSSDKTSTL
jgi:hypothetical protein